MSNKVVKPRKITAKANMDFTRTRREIDMALGRGDVPHAALLADRALAAGLPAEPMLLNLAAWLREERGDFAGAHTLLARALSLAPGDPAILGAIGAVLRKEWRLDEALATLDRALAIAPMHAAAWLERGYTLDALRREADAGDSYRRALSIDPNLFPALGKLADAAARRGERDEATALAKRARAIDPNDASAAAALATVALEQRQGEAAERIIRGVLPHVQGDDRTRSLTLLGDALDRQNRTAEAFSAWREAQENFRSIYHAELAPTAEHPSHRFYIERIVAQVEQSGAPVILASNHVSGAARQHVFLLGYPRSGTTLVENVLASAPGVSALEERNTLGGCNGVLIAEDGAMVDLDALDADLVAHLRSDYWARVRAMGGATDGMFVDMNPFNGVKLPIIARLFPDARILLMRRDPRDVVLSCFRINFTPSSSAWSFSDLEEAARHYDALMRLTELARGRLPLLIHEVRYDRLVTDFESTVREMAAFIGLPWTDDFRRFDRTAQTRGVRTASATQVRRGLYDGRGQWRRYERELAPVLPILQPWVERFSFEP